MPATYGFNYSQDIINLQTKYSLFKRVANILFSLRFDGGFNENLMTRALGLLIERNDCLRLTFRKEKGKMVQSVEASRALGGIPVKVFGTFGKMESFIHSFRKKGLAITKGEVIRPVYATGPEGERLVIIKISHMVADTYGIGILVSDLVAVYKALEAGTELPPAPGSFETVLQKDAEYRAQTEAVDKDRAFFKEYYEVRHKQAPVYCGLNGNFSDRWMKYKRKGNIALPYLLIKCDTEGYRFVIPAAVAAKAGQWCANKGVTLNTFFFYTCAVAASLANGKAPYQLPLELLNCRATLADRKAAGTKVQSISVYTTVDYKKSFADNLSEFFADQNELYKHTRLTYLEIEAIQHKLWNYSMLSQLTNFCFSYIPVSMPEGIRMQVYSNGKGALVAYIALMHDVRSGEIEVTYDIQKRMITPAQLVDFQNSWVHVVETVLAQDDKPLDDIL